MTDDPKPLIVGKIAEQGVEESVSRYMERLHSTIADLTARMEAAEKNAAHHYERKVAAIRRANDLREALRITINMLKNLDDDIELDPLGDIIGYARRALAAIPEEEA